MARSKDRSITEVPLAEAMPVFEELWRRLGNPETARRLGVNPNTMAPARWRKQAYVRLDFFLHAKAVLAAARAKGEDNYDYRASRFESPQAGGRATAENRRAAQADHESYLHEMKMEAWYSSQREDDEMWALGYSLADRFDD